MKHRLNTKGRNRQNSHMVGYFKKLFSVVERTSRQKISIMMEDMKRIINLVVLIVFVELYQTVTDMHSFCKQTYSVHQEGYAGFIKQASRNFKGLN